MRNMYLAMVSCMEKVSWRKLFFNNMARPRAKFILWQGCSGWLATKDHMCKFGLVADMKCIFCPNLESHNHLFFDCNVTKEIWSGVLNWLQVCHSPSEWHAELSWITQHCKGKGWRAALLKCAITETIYYIWKHRNDKIFGKDVNNRNIYDVIIDTIIYRVWANKKYRKNLAVLML